MGYFDVIRKYKPERKLQLCNEVVLRLKNFNITEFYYHPNPTSFNQIFKIIVNGKRFRCEGIEINSETTVDEIVNCIIEKIQRTKDAIGWFAP